jgi:hypothetical protein
MQGPSRHYAFRGETWAEIRERLTEAPWAAGEADHLFEIIDSVTAAGADEVLAVSTSMHDLVVALAPVAEPADDVVVVRAPDSLRTPAPGTVRIEFRSGTGVTEIERPSPDAVGLFWQFLETEYGLRRTAG